MIPVYKLEKLPRTQKLRKIAKIFTMAENRLCMSARKNIDIFTQTELVFFSDSAKLLTRETSLQDAEDELFPPEALKVFREAAVFFESATSENFRENFRMLSGEFLRTLNSVKHILLTATGRDQADWDFTNSDGLLDPAGRKISKGMYVYMEDIRSPFNVGAMFRTAESFGVEKIILSPFCADPRHRRAERTAMGCIDIVPWERKELFASEQHMPDIGPVFALETGGTPIDEFAFPQRGLLIAGSEELGVSPRALAAADASYGRVSIPVCGVKASLNVSVAFGIALHKWSKTHVEETVFPDL